MCPSGSRSLTNMFVLVGCCGVMLEHRIAARQNDEQFLDSLRHDAMK